MNNAAKFFAIAATALTTGAAFAEPPAQPYDWAVEMHSSIPAQGNAALQKIQNDIRQRAGNIEADFLPPQIWSLNTPKRDDRSES